MQCAYNAARKPFQVYLYFLRLCKCVGTPLLRRADDLAAAALVHKIRQDIFSVIFQFYTYSKSTFRMSHGGKIVPEISLCHYCFTRLRKRWKAIMASCWHAQIHGSTFKRETQGRWIDLGHTVLQNRAGRPSRTAP